MTRSKHNSANAAQDKSLTNTPAKQTTKRKAPHERDSPAKKSASQHHDSVVANRGASPALVPAVLSFSFQEAKAHLVSVDRRFEDMFRKMACKPFENLEQVHPFRCVALPSPSSQLSMRCLIS